MNDFDREKEHVVDRAKVKARHEAAIAKQIRARNAERSLPCERCLKSKDCEVGCAGSYDPNTRMPPVCEPVFDNETPKGA